MRERSPERNETFALTSSTCASQRLEGLTHALQERDAHAAAAARAEVARPASSSVAHHRPPLNPRAATAPVVFAHLDEPSATAPPPPLVLMPSQPSVRAPTHYPRKATELGSPRL